MIERSIQVGACELRGSFERLLKPLQYGEREARETVDEFLLEERRSGPGQGIRHFLRSLESVRNNALREPQIERRRSTVQIDAGGHFAHRPFASALPELVESTRTRGVAAMAIRNDVTFVRGGYPAYRLAQENLVAIVTIFVNLPVCSPAGIGERVLGSNPIAFAAPTSERPFVFDMATSSMAWRRFQAARETGGTSAVPVGTDERGEPTCELGEVVGLLPVGGNRGLGLVLLGEILAGSLLEYGLGPERTRVDDYGVFIIAVDPAVFCSLDAFKARNTRLFQQLGAMSGGRVRVPGSTYPNRSEFEGSYDVPRKAWAALQDGVWDPNDQWGQ